MPYGMSDAEYAAEVNRKRQLGLPLTGTFDQAAYERGMAQLSSKSSSSSSSSKSSSSSSSSKSSSSSSSSKSSSSSLKSTSGGSSSSGSASKSTNYWDQYTGGLQGYIASQQERYRQAVANNDYELIKKLEADAARVGYELPKIQQVQPQVQPQTQNQAQPQTQNQAQPQTQNQAQPQAQQQGTQADRQRNIQYILDQLSQRSQQALYPYEQLLRDLMAQMPSYKQPSQEELLQQAQLWAKLQVDPALQALSETLAKTKQALEAQKAQTEAQYAGVDQSVNRYMEEAAQKALESAISRGGGRSGQVEWYTSKLQQPIAEQYAKTQAEKAAALSDIAAKIALAEQQAAEQQKTLEQRRGELEANRLAELQNLAHATATGDWQRAFQAAQNLASLATQAQQWQMSYAANLLPYFTITEYERQTQPLQWAQTMGQVPETLQQPTPTSYYVPLRQYASNYGASVDYDPSTGEVIINGRRYSPNYLRSIGGQIVNNAWQIPASAVNALLAG